MILMLIRKRHFRGYVIPIRSETSSTMLVAISHALCRRRLHRVGCEKQALSMDP